MREFGVDAPATARILFDWVLSHPRSLSNLSFAVNALPPTLNHMYDTRARGQRVLTDECRRFRELTALAIGGKRNAWKPSGQVMAMIFLSTPHWITKKHTVRDMDGDNRIKPLFDAIQLATGVPDFTNWQIHCWKLASPKVRTTVYLFDLGDLVDWYL